MSPTNAVMPNAVHTVAYPARSAESAPCARGAADAWANSRMTGRLEGSIIAAIITCQDRTKMGTPTHSGGPFSMSVWWCNALACPVAAVPMASSHAMPMTA